MHHLFLKLSNVFVYVFFLTSNLYSITSPEGRKDSYLGSEHQTYLTPAPFGFVIWGLIHLLLGGFVVYQFFPQFHRRRDVSLTAREWIAGRETSYQHEGPLSATQESTSVGGMPSASAALEEGNIPVFAAEIGRMEQRVAVTLGEGEAAKEVDVEGLIFHAIGTAFILSALLNSFWFVLWQNDHLMLASLMMFFVYVTVSYIYYNTVNRFPPTTWLDVFFVHAPFSMWHAWTLVIFVVTVVAAFTSPTSHDLANPSTGASIFSVLALMFLTLNAIGYTEYPLGGDLIGAWTVAWALFAIAAQQPAPIVHWIAGIFGIVILTYSIKPFMLRVRHQHPDVEY